ncbi:MAG TPA: ATP-binding protein [Gemmatimonadota bacterium]|nr:ATP-binding protein [Gemmatimonadota bacterium]
MNPPAAPAVSSLNRKPQFAAPVRPPVPRSLEETGLSAEALSELLLKTLYVQGSRSGRGLSEAVRLPFAIVDERLQEIQQRQLIEVRGVTGHGRGAYTYDLTAQGRARAREAMDAGQYVGPAPVPLAKYRSWVEAGTIRNAQVTREEIESGFSHLVLDPAFLELMGPAINSAKSMFLYGDSGNGKTTLAEAIARMMGGDLYVPYAVDVDGHVMVIHDPVYHRVLEDAPENGREAGEPDWLHSAHYYDGRFARVARPVVFTGGELNLEQLDLRYDPHTKIYQAPFQVKANGGVLIIDDFGRQIVRPRDLLNRWIVPLEKRIDFLTLHTGHKFPVPFDCLLIFATNLDPLDLVDEAFLRRIHYKILVPDPTPDQYMQIFRRCCIARRIPFQPDAVRWVYEEYYRRHGIVARSCHPRDIVDHLTDSARYLDVEPELTQELLKRACTSYFLDTPDVDDEPVARPDAAFFPAVEPAAVEVASEPAAIGEAMAPAPAEEVAADPAGAPALAEEVAADPAGEAAAPEGT